MKFCEISKDGGPESKVWAYWLIEIKWLFSIVLLRFEDGSREAFHSHAFNAKSWVLSGELVERFLHFGSPRRHVPRLRSITTRRMDFHKVTSVGRTWVLSFRGPWSDTWMEYVPATDTAITLTHGRVALYEHGCRA